MGVYSEIDLGEINDILKYYEMGHAVDYQATIAGISNSNYKVVLDDGKKVLLKVSNDKTIEQLVNEQNILLTLKKYEYPYALKAFKTIQGKPIYHHGNFYGVIFPFIEGFPPEINPKTIRQIGEALGVLHSLEIRKEDLATIRPHDLVGYGGLSINEYTLTKRATSDFVESFVHVFPDRLQEIPYDIFPAGIIHGDLYYDNSLFNDDKLVTLIDFEQSGRGRFILDLGIALSGSCLNEDKSTIDLNLVKCFLEGYEQKRRLVTIEREYLKTAILVGFYSIALWRIKRFYEGHLDERKKFNYRELLWRAENFNQIDFHL